MMKSVDCSAKRLGDLARGARPSQSPGPLLHRRQARGIVEKAIDLPCDDGQVVTTNRRALLEEVISVALLLTGDRVDDDKRESACESLGGRPAARLPYQQVRSRHQFVHLRGEADHLDRDVAVARHRGHFLDAALEVLATSADDDDLSPVRELPHAADDMFDRTDAEAAG